MNMDKLLAEARLLKEFASDLEELHRVIELRGTESLSGHDRLFLEHMARILTLTAGPLTSGKLGLRQYYKSRLARLRHSLCDETETEVTSPSHRVRASDAPGCVVRV